MKASIAALGLLASVANGGSSVWMQQKQRRESCFRTSATTGGVECLPIVQCLPIGRCGNVC